MCTVADHIMSCVNERGLRIDRTVTHGISCSIYFYDPEDNRLELYYKTG